MDGADTTEQALTGGRRREPSPVVEVNEERDFIEYLGIGDLRTSMHTLLPTQHCQAPELLPHPGLPSAALSSQTQDAALQIRHIHRILLLEPFS